MCMDKLTLQLTSNSSCLRGGAVLKQVPHRHAACRSTICRRKPPRQSLDLQRQHACVWLRMASLGQGGPLKEPRPDAGLHLACREAGCARLSLVQA